MLALYGQLVTVLAILTADALAAGATSLATALISSRTPVNIFFNPLLPSFPQRARFPS
jgi:hypothetical protein